MIRIQLQKIGWEKVRRLEQGLKTVDKDPLFLNQAGTLIASGGKRNINEGSATGVASYPLLAPSTISQKQRQGFSLAPLTRTGQLKQSLGYELGGGHLYMTGKYYAKYHQFGTKKMPKRPLFFLRKEDLQDLQDFITNILKRTIQ